MRVLDKWPDVVSPLDCEKSSVYGDYKGSYLNGKYHGKGRYIWTNGDSYDGNWQKGKPHGRGVLSYANNATYTGEFFNGKRHGHGEMLDRFGLYNGEWLDDLRHGCGKQIRTDGQQLQGLWSKGEFQHAAAGEDSAAAPESGVAAERKAAQQILAALSSDVWNESDRLLALSPLVSELPLEQQLLLRGAPVHWCPLQRRFEGSPSWEALSSTMRSWASSLNAAAASFATDLQVRGERTEPVQSAKRIERWTFAYCVGYVGDTVADLLAVEWLLGKLPAAAQDGAQRRRQVAAVRGSRRQDGTAAAADVSLRTQVAVVGCPVPPGLLPALRQMMAGQALQAAGELREAQARFVIAIDFLIIGSGAPETVRQKMLLLCCVDRMACAVGMADRSPIGALRLGEALADLDYCAGFLEKEAVPLHILDDLRRDAEHLLHCLSFDPLPGVPAGPVPAPVAAAETAVAGAGGASAVRALGAVGDPEECPVCLMNMADLLEEGMDVAVLPCRHAVCGPCAEALMAGSAVCPLCRSPYGGWRLPPAGKRAVHARFQRIASERVGPLSKSIGRLCASPGLREKILASDAAGTGVGSGKRPVGVLRAVADPTRRGPVAYGAPIGPPSAEDAADAADGDAAQLEAINGLRFELEGIQGPPGSGKSETIVRVLESRLPAGEVTLVACAQNKAVDALVAKLERRARRLPFFVLGAPTNDKLGATAARFTLWAQIERDPAVVRWSKQLERLKLAQEAAGAGLAPREILEHRRQKQALRWFLAEAEKEARLQLLREARVVLGTIGACQNLYLRWHHVGHYAMPPGRRIRTVIIDEAGAVPERRLPVLAAIAPDRLLLVGDHRQLAPFTAIRASRAARPARSLLERVACAVEAAGGRLPMLRTQYRMHPALARLVSDSFYGGRLRTDPAVAAERNAASPLAWPGSGALAALDTEAESGGGRPLSFSKGVVWVDYDPAAAAAAAAARKGGSGGGGGGAEEGEGAAAGEGGAGGGGSVEAKRGESRWNAVEVELVLSALRNLAAAVHASRPAGGGATASADDGKAAGGGKRGGEAKAGAGGVEGGVGEAGDGGGGEGRRQRTIMVTSFYQAQVEAIARAVEQDPALRELAAGGALRVVTVDGAQGDEADYVVLSMVRCGGRAGGIGFLNKESRLCVAVSRARALLVVVGHAETMRASRNRVLGMLLKAAEDKEGQLLRPAELGLMRRRWFWLVRLLLARWRPARKQVGRVLLARGELDAFIGAGDAIVGEDEGGEEEEPESDDFW